MSSPDFKFEMFMREGQKGLILRVFATDPADVESRVGWVRETAEIAQGLRFFDRPAFDRIDVMIFVDRRFDDRGRADGTRLPRRNDCGLTEAALRKMLAGLAGERNGEEVRGYLLPGGMYAYVHAIQGDLFCGLLNGAIGTQMLAGTRYSTILSSDARSYLTPETMRDVYQAMSEGACAAGVAINEVRGQVLEGRFTNAFSCWRTWSLAQVGFFDLQAAMQDERRSRGALRDWSAETEEPNDIVVAGTEEVIALARLIDLNGECFAPILPSGQGIQQYQEPDPVTQRALWNRNNAKNRSKLVRQDTLLAAAGYGPNWLKGGVMRKYRRF